MTGLSDSVRGARAGAASSAAPDMCLTKVIGRSLGFVGKTALLTSCVVNFAMTPYIECQLDGGSGCETVSPLTGVYARSMSVACFASSAIMWYAYRAAIDAYDGQMELHDFYSPTSGAELCEYAAFKRTVACLCLAMVLPVNAVRLYGLYGAGWETDVLVYFANIYTQNVAMCLSEARFVGLCYAVYRKFDRVNRDMERIGDGIGDDARVASPFPVSPERSGTRTSGRDWIAADDEDDDLRDGRRYYSRTTGQPLVDAVEVLRIRHRLVREAVDQLRRLFAVPVGLSLLNLFVMALFDIYDQLADVYVENTKNGIRSRVFICMWLLQYTYRFFVIVMTAHAMAKQAFRSKEIVTNISSFCLDVNTKEELQIFSNQISSTSMEFTICDLFTLNTYLFTSAIGAGITYLVILLQIKS